MSFLRNVLNEIVSLLSFESPAREEEFVLDTQRKMPGLTSDVPQTGAPRTPAPGQSGGRQTETQGGRNRGHDLVGRPPQRSGPSETPGVEPSAVARLEEALPRTPYGFIRPRKMSTIKARGGFGARQRTSLSRDAAPQEASDEIFPAQPGGDDSAATGQAGRQGGARGQQEDEVKRLAESLQANLDALKQVLHYGLNSDVVVREFDIPTTPPTKAAIVFMEGLSSKDIINLAILQPLMLISHLDRDLRAADVLEIVERRLLPGNQVSRKDNLRGVIEGVIAGTTCLLIEGCSTALEIETKSWEHRSVDQPTAEMVVHGPQEAFNETLKNNVALVRRRMRTPDLVSELLKVGTLSRVDCAVLYVEGLTNPKLVAEVKRRINGITADQIQDTGVLEQFIEDKPFVMAPQTLSTERPDRMAAYLSEGHVGILIDGSPFGLVVPATFWSLLHAAEDHFLRWPFGTFLRFVRVVALAAAILLPAVYVAVTNFHPEMIPTDLLLAIAATREKVPFPTVVEVLIMEVSLELIREAGIRVPGVIGPTLGIVGALILGQAAVAASIVSPILVIIVALTALGSFAIPNFNMAFAARITRFIYIMLAAALGFYGIAVGVFIQMMIYVSIRSFGVPFMSPVAPFAQASGDIIMRYPSWSMELRPKFLQTQHRERQPEVARKWTQSAGADAPSPAGAAQSPLGVGEAGKGKPRSQQDEGGGTRA
ncbi:MAG: spore germination protein [Clostridia bacterium]